MSQTLSEYLTAQFYTWEQRGRGWNIYDKPVQLEPIFIPFFGHNTPVLSQSIDDGKRPRFFPRLQSAFGWDKKNDSRLNYDEVLNSLEEQYPIEAYEYNLPDEISEIQLLFDKDTKIDFARIEQLLLMLSSKEGIIAFEIIGTSENIEIQLAFDRIHFDVFHSLISIYTPEITIQDRTGNLKKLINDDHAQAIVSLGLRDEFMLPLRIWDKFFPDPLSSVFAVLESLKNNEVGIIQILFQPAINAWPESVFRAISDGKGGSFFNDSKEMLSLAKEKTSSPLFATVVRTFGQAGDSTKSSTISQQLAQSFYSFHRNNSNTLIALLNKQYCTTNDILLRRSKRTGMLLNSQELVSMVHIPDNSLLSSKLRAQAGKSKKIPLELNGNPFELGINQHLGQENLVTLSVQHRLRHMHVIGATGTGKSSLLLKLIAQDINQGNGLTLLDPHGDLIDDVIGHIPEKRLKDVILIDPSNNYLSIGLNLFSTATELEKILLSSDLVSLFKRFATSWGDQMTSVLANAIDAILDNKHGGTLLDLRRFLIEPDFRSEMLKSIEDPNTNYFWTHEFPLLKRNSIASILTRLDTFLRPKIIRNMMAKKEGIDFGNVLNSKKILLVKLAQGIIGEENSYLLGSLFVTKLHQAAQSRQIIQKDKRTPHFLYIDEFQNFITPSMSSILSGARKYGLGLILAHQDLDQLMRKDSELANSVLSNPAVRICFKCGDKDASRLDDGFSYFDSSDLQSLPIGQAVVRVGRKDHDFNMNFTLLPTEEIETIRKNHEEIITNCHRIYGILNEQIDEKEPVQKTLYKSGISEEKEEEAHTKETETTSKNIKKQAKQFIENESKQVKQREHRYIQEYVKKIGEARNFKVLIEEPVNDNKGSVDVGLHRDDIKIACEVAVTNTVDYELKNIQKCLDAEFSLVFIISNNLKHLDNIRKLAVSKIDDSLLGKVFFVSKEDFVKQLDLLLSTTTKQVETRTKGYRVKLNYVDSSNPMERKKALKEIMLSSLRKRDNKNDD